MRSPFAAYTGGIQPVQGIAETGRFLGELAYKSLSDVGDKLGEGLEKYYKNQALSQSAEEDFDGIDKELEVIEKQLVDSGDESFAPIVGRIREYRAKKGKFHTLSLPQRLSAVGEGNMILKGAGGAISLSMGLKQIKEQNVFDRTYDSMRSGAVSNAPEADPSSPTHKGIGNNRSILEWGRQDIVPEGIENYSAFSLPEPQVTLIPDDVRKFAQENGQFARFERGEAELENQLNANAPAAERDPAEDAAVADQIESAAEQFLGMQEGEFARRRHAERMIQDEIDRRDENANAERMLDEEIARRTAASRPAEAEQPSRPTAARRGPTREELDAIRLSFNNVASDSGFGALWRDRAIDYDNNPISALASNAAAILPWSTESELDPQRSALLKAEGEREMEAFGDTKANADARRFGLMLHNVPESHLRAQLGPDLASTGGGVGAGGADAGAPLFNPEGVGELAVPPDQIPAEELLPPPPSASATAEQNANIEAPIAADNMGRVSSLYTGRPGEQKPAVANEVGLKFGEWLQTVSPAGVSSPDGESSYNVILNESGKRALKYGQHNDAQILRLYADATGARRIGNPELGYGLSGSANLDRQGNRTSTTVQGVIPRNAMVDAEELLEADKQFMAAVASGEIARDENGNLPPLPSEQYSDVVRAFEDAAAAALRDEMSDEDRSEAQRRHMEETGDIPDDVIETFAWAKGAGIKVGAALLASKDGREMAKAIASAPGEWMAVRRAASAERKAAFEKADKLATRAGDRLKAHLHEEVKAGRLTLTAEQIEKQAAERADTVRKAFTGRTTLDYYEKLPQHLKDRWEKRYPKLAAAYKGFGGKVIPKFTAMASKLNFGSDAALGATWLGRHMRLNKWAGPAARMALGRIGTGVAKGVGRGLSAVGAIATYTVVYPTMGTIHALAADENVGDTIGAYYQADWQGLKELGSLAYDLGAETFTWGSYDRAQNEARDKYNVLTRQINTARSLRNKAGVNLESALNGRLATVRKEQTAALAQAKTAAAEREQNIEVAINHSDTIKEAMWSRVKGQIGRSAFDRMYEARFPNREPETRVVAGRVLLRNEKGGWDNLGMLPEAGSLQDLRKARMGIYGEPQKDGTWRPESIGNNIMISGAFRGPDGDISKFGEAVVSASQGLDSLDTLENLMQTHGRALSPEQRAIGETARRQLVGALRIPFMGPGQMTEQERAEIKDIINNPATFMSLDSTSKRQIEMLRRYIASGLITQGRFNGIEVKVKNYRPDVRSNHQQMVLMYGGRAITH